MAYPKLDIMTMPQAVKKGLLNNARKHMLYKEVLKHSNRRNASAGALFNYNKTYPELKNLGRGDMLDYLRELIIENLVIVFLEIEFSEASGRLQPVTYFYAFSSIDEVNPDYILEVIVENSTKAVRAFFESREWSDQARLKADLKTDFQPADAAGEFSDCSVFSLYNSLDLKELKIEPYEPVIHATVDAVEKAMLEEGLLAGLEGFEMVVTRPDELKDRYTVLVEYLTRNLVPYFKSNKRLHRQFDAIHLEESIAAEKRGPETTFFHMQRAMAIEKMYTEPGNARPRPYPGRLCVEMLKACAPSIEKQFKENWAREVEEQYMTTRSELLNATGWYDSIMYIEQGDESKLSEDALSLLMADRAFVHTSWELPRKKIIAVTPAGRKNLRRLVRGMLTRPTNRQHEILMIKALLEKAEQDISDLFEGADFVAAYGRLLYRAYVNYIPWFYRIMIFLRIPMFKDRAFQMAKDRISQRRMLDRKKYENRQGVIKRHATDRQAKLRELKNKNALTALLDQCYYADPLTVPTVSEIMAESPLSDTEFRSLLTSRNFQVISIDGTAENDLLFYPLDQEWRQNSQAVLQQAGTILSAPENWPQIDEKTIAGLKAVKDFLEQKRNENIPAEEDDSAFEKFAREIQKLKTGHFY